MSGVSRASLWAGSMRSSAAALSFLSYYRANEVQQFRYSRPFRKGEKDPENEFAVSSLGLFSLQLGWELGLHVSVWRPEVSLGGHSSGASLLVIWTKGSFLGAAAYQPSLAGCQGTPGNLPPSLLPNTGTTSLCHHPWLCA